MKLLISGICGFVGSTLANALLDTDASIEIAGFDNFSRPGSELNVAQLRRRSIKVTHADLRSASDMESLPPCDCIIDAAANASVLAGVTGNTTSRQLVEHNLYGTINLLEKAKRERASFILLSTSRVYSINPLASIEVREQANAFEPLETQQFPNGLSTKGIAETFSTAAPVSLYGATKLASEQLALEYGEAFDFPVWINRCGVLAGAGQFGRPDQGIFAYWINSYLRRAALRYTGFRGTGFQVRDCFHPRDLVPIVLRQASDRSRSKPRVVNFGGGRSNAMSLAQLSEWCEQRFGQHEISRDPTDRPFDLPWIVMDCSLARQVWNWQPTTSLDQILQEIAVHAEQHPDWLDLSNAR